MKAHQNTPSLKKQEEEIMKEKYPVQQVSIKKNSKITEKVVEAAVKEINPDKNSLGFRG